jgi:dTMP kinase
VTIRPALARGAIVLCDRFMDSTTAYQGHAGGVDLAFIRSLEHAVVGDTRPQITLVFDVDPELGLERARQRDPGNADRFERMGLAFHQRLRAGFLEIARAEPGRCVLVDASRDKDDVARAVWETVAARIAG